MLFAAATFLAGVGLTVIESVFMRATEIAGIRPDIIALVVVIGTCRMSFRRVMAMAFMMGLARDFFSGGLVGMSSFSLTFMAFVLAGAEEYLLSDNWKAQTFIVFLGSAIFGALFVFLKLVVGYEIASALRTLEIIAGTAAYTAALAPAAFALTKRPERAPYRRLRRKYHDDSETIYQA